MLLSKYRILIVLTFLGIFTAKMVISGAPVFFAHLDKDLMSAVIMQLETENNSDDPGKSNVKFGEQKLMFQRFDVNYIPQLITQGIKNSFIDHSRRYVDPYHPSVPTPPPNFS
ncbi:hypothetical protein [Pedobacter insulae]|uniref:Uncharacterized protein n=1 Tax=Pedobacter insulae TaxID=414048 RepID=A0A1I2W0W3_9SPHI|nr:hypothetical protein [Pedobacter insulae]SFG95065.1 hypothetical protein SAMN04489864_103397 [Pedobacter insulae]